MPTRSDARRAAPRRKRAPGRNLPVAAVALVCLLPATGHAACEAARFGQSATKTCPRAEGTCMPDYLPPEIKSIAKGAVVESVGLTVNDGRATWRALDRGRGEVVVVERYAGRKLGQAPRVAGLTALTCVASADWAQGVPTLDRTDTAGRAYLLLDGGKVQSESSLGTFRGAPGELVQAIDDVVKRQRPGVVSR